MRTALIGVLAGLVVAAGGCMTRHELIIVVNEPMCEMYGITGDDINRAVARGPRDVKGLGQMVVKRLPDGTIIRLRQVASVHYRERKR